MADFPERRNSALRGPRRIFECLVEGQVERKETLSTTKSLQRAPSTLKVGSNPSRNNIHKVIHNTSFAWRSSPPISYTCRTAMKPASQRGAPVGIVTRRPRRPRQPTGSWEDPRLSTVPHDHPGRRLSTRCPRTAPSWEVTGKCASCGRCGGFAVLVAVSTAVATYILCHSGVYIHSGCQPGCRIIYYAYYVLSHPGHHPPPRHTVCLIQYTPSITSTQSVSNHLIHRRCGLINQSCIKGVLIFHIVIFIHGMLIILSNYAGRHRSIPFPRSPRAKRPTI